MKTVFITSFHSLVPRNILLTPVIERLTAAGVRVVVLVPENKKKYFIAAFSRNGLIIEGIPVGARARGRWDRFAGRVFHLMAQSRSMRIQHRARFSRRPLANVAYTWLNRVARIRQVRTLARRLDALFSRHARFASLLDHHKPTLIFSTDVMDKYDIALTHEARRRRVEVVHMVRSWDNLTKFSLMRVVPRFLLVWNEFLRAEAVDLHDVPWECVRVVGIPHYDRYRAARHARRGDPLRELRRGSADKVILFCPTGAPRLVDATTDQYHMDILSALGNKVLVRVPPTNPVTLETRARPNAFIDDELGPVFSRSATQIDCILDDAADRRLIEEVESSDVVVTGPSTIMIDAAFFDKPTILVDFDRRGRPMLNEAEESCDSEHIQNVLRTDGVRVARSQEELLGLMEWYLGDASHDRAGRIRLVEEQCGFLDGAASERVASFLLKRLNPRNKV